MYVLREQTVFHLIRGRPWLCHIHTLSSTLTKLRSKHEKAKQCSASSMHSCMEPFYKATQSPGIHLYYWLSMSMRSTWEATGGNWCLMPSLAVMLHPFYEWGRLASEMSICVTLRCWKVSHVTQSAVREGIAADRRSGIKACQEADTWADMGAVPTARRDGSPACGQGPASSRVPLLCRTGWRDSIFQSCLQFDTQGFWP